MCLWQGNEFCHDLISPFYVVYLLTTFSFEIPNLQENLSFHPTYVNLCHSNVHRRLVKKLETDKKFFETIKAAPEDDHKKNDCWCRFWFHQGGIDTQVMKTLSNETLRSVPGESRPVCFYGSVGCQYWGAQTVGQFINWSEENQVNFFGMSWQNILTWIRSLPAFLSVVGRWPLCRIIRSCHSPGDAQSISAPDTSTHWRPVNPDGWVQ